PDGQVRWCVGTAAATLDKAGRVVRVSGVTVDITERKHAEERQNRLVDEELAPYSLGNRISLSGPQVQLRPATAQTLALALHELVTNSAKYGALSSQSGRLSVTWADQDGVLHLVWHEEGGPPVRQPTPQGLGTRSALARIETP